MISNKDLLRKEMLCKRKNIENRHEIDKNIFDNLFSLECVLNSKNVFCYVSTQYEVDTLEIIKKLLSYNKTVCVPKVRTNTSLMDAVKIACLGDLIFGEFKILEPIGFEVIEKNNIDVIIIPALVFDKFGYRLGYGKGFYDRYLVDFNGKKIGLCRDEFLINNVFAQPHDIPVDIIVTQKNIIYCAKN